MMQAIQGLAVDSDAIPMAQFVTLRLNGQLAGLPIEQVRDVFVLKQITPVPQADPAVLGLVNMRGRIIPVLSLAVLLGLDPGEPAARRMAVSVDVKGEIYGVQIDNIGDVLTLPLSGSEDLPGLVHSVWKTHARRVHKLDHELMIELDLASLLASPLTHAANPIGENR